jgi:PilZ domain
MDPDRNGPAAAGETAEPKAEPEATQRGRYIPYSGGSAGWFENSGVLKSEARNNYQFQKEMDLPEMRTKLFLRWGPAFDRRQTGVRRRRVVPINLLKQGSSVAMNTFDINSRGIRLQFDAAPTLALGDEVSVEVLNAPGGAVLTMLDAQVIWQEQSSGAAREVWDLGLFFPFVSAESSALLTQMLAD